MSRNDEMEQERMDADDAQVRLNRLADALCDEVAAGEVVRMARATLKKAEAALATARARARELSFIERRRRKQERG